jgi:hypothetical protein
MVIAVAINASDEDNVLFDPIYNAVLDGKADYLKTSIIRDFDLKEFLTPLIKDGFYRYK